MADSSSSLRERGFSSKRTFGIFSLAFFSYGFVSLLTHDNILAGVEDIFENTDYSTGWISLMINLPYLFTTLGLQSVKGKFKTVHRMWLSCALTICGSVGVGYMPLIPLRIASACMTGIGNACLSITIMSISAKFPDSLLFINIIGKSVGRMASPFIYAVSASYLCIKPELVFLTISLTSLAYPLYFHLLLNKNPEDHRKDKDTDTALLITNKKSEDNSNSDGGSEMYEVKKITCKVQLSLIYKSFFRLYNDFMGFFLQTFSLQCFFTTLAFQNSPFPPREHYQYYLMANWTGVFVGTNSWYLGKYCGKILSLNTDIKACILVVINLCNFTVLFQAVWYRNIPNFWIILVISFVIGFIAGNAITLAALSLVSKQESHIAYIRRVVIIIRGAGAVTAASIAIFLEPLVRQRCFEVTHANQYCIARYIGIGRTPCYNTG